MPDGRMDTKNTAIYTGQKEKTLAQKRSDGTGPPFIKAGKIWYYKEDVDEWLAARERVTSTAQDRTLNAEIKTREKSTRWKKEKKVEDGDKKEWA